MRPCWPWPGLPVGWGALHNPHHDSEAHSVPTVIACGYRRALSALALAVFVLGLLALGLWWVRLVLSVVLGDRCLLM